MDGAQAYYSYPTFEVSSMLQRVGGRGAPVKKPPPVRAGGTGSSADLGGSSKYSNENFEDRSGERFHVNSSWTWVSRS